MNPLFRVWSWNNGVRRMSFYILMATLRTHISYSRDIFLATHQHESYSPKTVAISPTGPWTTSNCLWWRTKACHVYTYAITHWGRVAHICVGKQITIGSDNGLSPERRQAIIWIISKISLIGTLRTNFSQILSEIHTFSLKKMHLKMSSAKWRQFYLGLNVIPEMYCRVPFRYPIRRLIVRSRKVSKALDRVLQCSHRFNRHIDSSAAEVPGKFQSDRTNLNTNLAASRHCEIF